LGALIHASGHAQRHIYVTWMQHLLTTFSRCPKTPKKSAIASPFALRKRGGNGEFDPSNMDFPTVRASLAASGFDDGLT
jgi:hypothetical protein